MRQIRILLLVALALVTAAALSAQTTVPAGKTITVTLNQGVSSKDAKVGQKVDGSVSEAVTVEGKKVIAKGSKVTLTVVTAEPSGRLSGTAKLWLKIKSVQVGGATYTVDSDATGQNGPGHKNRNVIAIGGGAAAGAVIGAIAGGGKGAAIGTVVGAGAGTAGAAATGKKDVEYPAETKLRFALKSALTIQPASRAKKQ